MSPTRRSLSKAAIGLAIGVLVAVALPAGAKCPSGKQTFRRDPLEVTVDVRYSDAPNETPDACTLHGPVELKLASGSMLSSTFTFANGDVVAIDWLHKQVGGKYDEKGIEVDFAKNIATFKRKLVRCEMIVKRFGRGQLPQRFEHDQLIPSVDEESITLDVD